jgi:uncharacterized damage-inducible protein DinB
MGFANEYLAVVLKQFREIKQTGERAMAQCSFSELQRKIGKESNSIAVIVKHLHGNMLSRWTDFLTTDGEKTWRNRDDEFRDGYKNLEALMADWEKGWEAVFAALSSLTEEDLSKTMTIRGEKHSVIQAIERQIYHYSYHIGQIVFIAKSLKDDGWASLTIPKGKSEEFNRQMQKEERD